MPGELTAFSPRLDVLEPRTLFRLAFALVLHRDLCLRSSPSRLQCGEFFPDARLDVEIVFVRVVVVRSVPSDHLGCRLRSAHLVVVIVASCLLWSFCTGGSLFRLLPLLDDELPRLQKRVDALFRIQPVCNLFRDWRERTLQVRRRGRELTSSSRSYISPTALDSLPLTQVTNTPLPPTGRLDAYMCAL